MHSYATDSEEKKLVLFILAALSIMATWVTYELALWVAEQANLALPWWLEIPSVMAFYGALYGAFDKWAWKKSILRTLGLVKTPDLSGRWKGYIKSSHDGFKEEIPATIEIFQSWTQIGVSQKTQTSTGQSFAATILTKEPNATRLFFMYQNVPEADADPNMGRHIGSAQLVFSDGILSGDYYNCMRDRQTWGTLHFKKEPSNR
jgi:hypothetical protein